MNKRKKTKRCFSPEFKHDDQGVKYPQFVIDVAQAQLDTHVETAR